MRLVPENLQLLVAAPTTYRHEPRVQCRVTERFSTTWSKQGEAEPHPESLQLAELAALGMLHCLLETLYEEVSHCVCAFDWKL